MEEYLTVLKKYATFSGRARRKEYWMFTLFSFIISIILAIVDGAVGLKAYQDEGLFGTLYSAFIFIPSLAVASRRLHDIGKSGWLLLVIYVPMILFIAYIFYNLLVTNNFRSGGGKSMLSVMMIGAIGIIGLGIWMLVLMVTEGHHGKNEYGNVPKGTDHFKLTDHLI